MSKVTKYNVWVQIEGVDKHDDVLEGDSDREPHLIGEFKRAKDAEALVDRIDDMIEGAAEPASVFLNRWYVALGGLLDWTSGCESDSSYRAGAVEMFVALLSDEMCARKECVWVPCVSDVVTHLELGDRMRPRSLSWYEQRLHRLYKSSLAKGKVITPVSRRETGKATVS